MKIKFLLAVMLFAAINVFGQTPTFTSISQNTLTPGDQVTITGTNLTGVTKVVLKWNNPSNTNTLTITPVSVSATSIFFIVPDTSFFWYAHYNGDYSIDLVNYFVIKNNQLINTSLNGPLMKKDPIFTTIFGNTNGTNFKGRYLWDDALSLGLTDNPYYQFNIFGFVKTYTDSMTFAGNFVNASNGNALGNCEYFGYLIKSIGFGGTGPVISNYALDGTHIEIISPISVTINYNNFSQVLPCSGGSTALYASIQDGFVNSSNFATRWYLNGVLLEEHSYVQNWLPAQDSLVITLPGIYKLEVTRGSFIAPQYCTAVTDTILVTSQQQSFTATATSDGPTTFCSGNYVFLSATNVTGATYQWKKNGVNITSSGTSRTYKATATGSYTCVVTNACGSTTTNAIQVTTKTNAFATVSATGATSFCAGDSVTLNCTNLGSAYSVQWYRTNISMENATAYSKVVKQPGTYKVVTKNIANGCSRISGSSVTVAVNCRMANPDAVAVEDENEEESKSIDEAQPKTIRVFPNPNSGSFTFEYQTTEEGTGDLQILNVMGQSIYNTSVSVTGGLFQQQIDLGDSFQKGIYVVRFTLNGEQHDRKLVLQ